MNSQLDTQVQSEIALFEGRVSLYAHNLRTGATYGVGEDTHVQTASTVKLAILVAAYAEVAAGRAMWDDALQLTEAKKVGGAGVLGELSEGLKLTLRDAVRLMMILSDNTATNLVLDRITIDAVNDYLDALGLSEIRSLNKIGGGGFSRALSNPAHQDFGLGVATPRAMVRLLVMLENGKVVSAEASQEMLTLLKHQYPYTGIGRHCPEIERACKSGALDALRSEVGILYMEQGPIAMAITCDQMPRPLWTVDNPGMLMLSKLSEMLCDGMGKV